MLAREVRERWVDLRPPQASDFGKAVDHCVSVWPRGLPSIVWRLGLNVLG